MCLNPRCSYLPETTCEYDDSLYSPLIAVFTQTLCSQCAPVLPHNSTRHQSRSCSHGNKRHKKISGNRYKTQNQGSYIKSQVRVIHVIQIKSVTLNGTIYNQSRQWSIFFLIGLPSNGVDFFLTWIFTTSAGIKIQSIVGRLRQGWREIICLSEWHQQTFNWKTAYKYFRFFLKPDCVYIYVRRKGHSSQNKGGGRHE